MALSDNATITMPVAPAYQAGGYGMWGGDLSSWFTLFLIFGMFGGWGGYGNGWGGNNGGSGDNGQYYDADYEVVDDDK